MKIVYVGLKPLKTDGVAGTGLTWTRGEVHDVEDEVKAAKLLEHPLIWKDASKEFELMPEPKAVPPEPRVSIIPSGEVSPYWEPVVIPVPAEVFAQLQKKELLAVFMSESDADAFAEWKIKNEDTAPRNTGPLPDISKMDKRSREYRELIAKHPELAKEKAA